MARPQRYNQILEVIEDCKPKVIVEVGVFNGERATLMAQAALKHNDHVIYQGYDLFEAATAMTNSEEMNAKTNHSQKSVAAKLTAFGRSLPNGKKFEFALFPGNTRETLGGKEIEADFAYIDGGHTVETIQNDYDALRNTPVIIFDDYYKDSDFNPDRVGCNKLIEELGGAVFPSNDPLTFEGKRSGTVHLVLLDQRLPTFEDTLFDSVHAELEGKEISDGTAVAGDGGNDQDVERQGSEAGGHERKDAGEEQGDGGEAQAAPETGTGSDGEEQGDQAPEEQEHPAQP